MKEGAAPRVMSRTPHRRSVRYEVLEHTADVGLKAYGGSLEEIFASAARGMFALMTDIATVRPTGEVQVAVTAPDRESLLVDWLTELLFVHERDGVFLAEFEVAIENHRLEATVRGEEIDPDRHPLDTEIKAVTYHMIEVNPEAGYAVVIFDI